MNKLKKKIYKIEARFIYEGYFEVKAKNKNEARDYVGKYCDQFVGSIKPDGNVENWSVNASPIKEIK